MSAEPPQPSQPPVILDPWLLSVTVVQMRSTGTASQACSVGSATGFFYRNNEDRYLITNRHVVINEANRFYPDSLVMRIHTSQRTTTQNRDVIIPLYDSERRPIWLEHPTNGSSEDNLIDIVAINIDSHHQPQDFITCLSAQNFVPPNVFFALGDQVLVMGYPMRFYDRMHNLPITKTGTLASSYGAHFEGHPFFLIDANLQPGTSGSPVILPGGSTRRLRNGFAVGAFPHSLLGIHSAEPVVSGIALGLHVVWYSIDRKSVV